jgi:hypothetical protein
MKFFFLTARTSSIKLQLLTERRSSSRLRHRDDVYAHEVFQRLLITACWFRRALSMDSAWAVAGTPCAAIAF